MTLIADLAVVNKQVACTEWNLATAKQWDFAAAD